MPANVPERWNVGVDQNGTVEILDDRWRVSIQFSLVEDAAMRVLVDVLDAPALEAQMIVDKLDRRLVLLEGDLNHLERLPANIKVSESLVKVKLIKINWRFNRSWKKEKNLQCDLGIWQDLVQLIDHSLAEHVVLILSRAFHHNLNKHFPICRF